MSVSFPFLDKIENRLGYLVIDESGAIVMSEGELANNERTAKAVREILYLERPQAPTRKAKGKTTEMRIDYQSSYYTIARSGKYGFCVKRKRIRPVPPEPPPPEIHPFFPNLNPPVRPTLVAQNIASAAARSDPNPLRLTQQINIRGSKTPSPPKKN
ncbi:unnamed protein product, partial [Mesorhabditis spiculigera]